jgi:hypothetical protein
MRVIVSSQESLFVAVMPGRRGALNLPDDAYANRCSAPPPCHGEAARSVALEATQRWDRYRKRQWL